MSGESERTALIRAWWAEYAAVLADPYNGLGKLDRLSALTARCEEAGIVRPGLWMTDAGAEDLSAQCQRLKAEAAQKAAALR